MLNKFLLSTILTLFSFAAFAQTPQVFAEKNLPDNSINPIAPSGSTPVVATSASQQPSPTAVTPANNVDSIESILLNKKLSSLMFDDEESSAIERTIESLKNNQIYSPEDGNDLNAETGTDIAAKAAEESEKSYIYLASIIYFTAKDWAIWINDQKITAETNSKDKEIYLKSVQKDRVKVVWKMNLTKWKIISGRNSVELAPKVNADNKIEIEFELKPNQTYILTSNNVVEGRAVIALLKKRAAENKANEVTSNQKSNSNISKKPKAKNRKSKISGRIN